MKASKVGLWLNNQNSQQLGIKGATVDVQDKHKKRQNIHECSIYLKNPGPLAWYLSVDAKYIYLLNILWGLAMR